MRNIIYITGTPGTGKTKAALKLAKKLKGEYINLGKICLEKGYTRSIDPTRKTPIINLGKLSRYVRQLIISKRELPLILDAHFMVKIPANTNPIIVVLRCEPIRLIKRLRRKGFPKKKIYENMWAETLDFCLQEALSLNNMKNVYEIDTTSTYTENVVDEILKIVRRRKKPAVGFCNWLKTLEEKGKLEEMLLLGERMI